MKTKLHDINEFLSESNAIEGVYDDDSLRQAKYAWKYLIAQDKLTISVILKTHKILMLHQPLRPDEKGYFRKVPVWIGCREGKPWYVIPELMDQWVKKANNIQTEIDTQYDHVEFETIHPFIDGNGRIGRMLMNWQRIKNKLSLLIIHTGQEQLNYYRWFI